jgi:hypothetical protein
MIFRTRDAVWPGGVIPSNSTGTPRPLLEPKRPYYTIHYTGAGVWLDENDTPTELRAIQNYATAAKKPWEYNYVIDGQGVVWEYAGTYRAAHAGPTNNAEAIGVLLLVGLTGPGLTGFEVPTEPMILAVRELRDFLVGCDALAQGHAMCQHRDMPGAQTICPGPEVISRWADLCAPIVDPPPTEEGCSMFIGFFRSDGPAVYAAYSGGYKVWVQNEPILEVMVALAQLAGKDSSTHIIDQVTLDALGPVIGPIP